MQTLRRGSRAIPVKLLQRLLNKNGTRPALKEDGIFGPKTEAAVKAFQARKRLPKTGVVDHSIWRNLGLVIDITHPVRLFPQPDGMTCWSAAATMIVGNMSVGPGSATLGPKGGLLPGPANVKTFGDGMGWRMHYPQTWTIRGLAGILHRKPLWAVGGGSGAGGNWLHAIVLSALWSDGAADGSGTMLRIHDPWPPNVGEVYGRFYHGTVSGFDFISMYILQPS